MHSLNSLDTTPAVRSLVRRLATAVAPPTIMSTTAWSRERRRLSEKATARPGKYNPDLTPWVLGIHEALDNPAVTEVVCMKSAQVAWTDGVLLNYIGRRIDLDPCPMILMFAKEEAAKEFNDEKLVPMIEVTPVLGEKIPIGSRRDRDNRWDYKGFAGGFLKLVGSNSPSSVKSTPSPVVAVEEPDDCNTNVREQGDTITLLKERTKSFPRRKVIFGGTPTIEGASNIEAGYKGSDQRKFWIPCPHCDEYQVLAWEQVRYVEDPASPPHEIYGHQQPESARYLCPHCGGLWTDAEKNRAVRRGEWRAGGAFRGVAGFYINELYSPFPGSKFARLVEKYLTAQYHLAAGDDTKARSFRNNTEGLPYAYKSDVPAGDELKTRAEAYAEKTAPRGGLLITAGVDVQHDRLAIVLRAWGRGEESWLVYWGEIYGSTLNPHGGAWLDLDKLLGGEIRHETGAVLFVSAASIDGSDGNRTEIVHEYVRSRRGRLPCQLLAVKGAAEQGDDKKEIFSTPRKADTGKKFKPSKTGLQTFIVGTARAKDLILETRVKLQGAGPGRLHWYESVRADYWEQLVSEVKAPSRLNRNRKVWTKKASVRNEALDCEVYALHAARSLKTNLMHDAHWIAIEKRLRQRTLLDDPAPTLEAAPLAEEESDTTRPPIEGEAATEPAAAAPPPAATPAPTPAPAEAVRTSGRSAKSKRRSGSGGFKVGSW